jgi:hypothetical protein
MSDGVALRMSDGVALRMSDGMTLRLTDGMALRVSYVCRRPGESCRTYQQSWMSDE